MKQTRLILFLFLLSLTVPTAKASSDVQEPLDFIAQEHQGHEQMMMPPAAESQEHGQMEMPPTQEGKPEQMAPVAPANEYQNHEQMTMPSAAPGQASDAMEMEPVTLDLTADTPEDLMMLNMRRQGSGTSWQPIDNPMLMVMKHYGPWMTMLHWNAFLDYNNQGGPRGRDKLVSENWFMASAMRPVGERGLVQLRGMMSADPFTMGKTGYPLLFQEGESVNGRPLIDFQHPHDLFMELSAQYWHQLAQKSWVFLYAAPVGEPALGPVAYPHRYSSLMNPSAVLSHHIQDSTHIAFGVLTAGLVHEKWQFETSLFNGREPDENRYDFDYNPFILSYSGRISYMPNQNWALQVSHGHLNSPETLKPGDIDRTTASVMNIRTWKTGWSATTLAVGHNFESGPDNNGVTLESTLNFKDKNYLYGRIENIQRHGLLTDDDEASFNITAFTLGIARDLFRFRGTPLTLGAQMSLYAKPGRLDEVYGNFPISFNIYLHTNAPRMGMAMQHTGNSR